MTKDSSVVVVVAALQFSSSPPSALLIKDTGLLLLPCLDYYFTCVVSFLSVFSVSLCVIFLDWCKNECLKIDAYKILQASESS